MTPATPPRSSRFVVVLDGIPLAIELAASRSGATSPEEIAGLLDERFRLLTGGRRNAVERHQTLRATVDWSYSLLGDIDRLGWHRQRQAVGPLRRGGLTCGFCGADDGIRTRDPNLGKVGTLQSLEITIAHDRAVRTPTASRHRPRTVVGEAFGWQVGWQTPGLPDSRTARDRQREQTDSTTSGPFARLASSSRVPASS